MDVDNVSRQVSILLYEIVAYFGSASFAIILFGWGVVNIESLFILQEFIRNLKTPELVILSLASLTITYVYGQLASAISSILILAPVNKFAKKFSFPTYSDFKYDFGPLVRYCSLSIGLPKEKINNRWTLIYFIITKAPNIGRDLFKRQARERLARINATNMLIISLISGCLSFAKLISITKYLPLNTILQSPNQWFILLCISLSLIFSYEFYLRRCWNNDLLIKILPVIRNIQSVASSENSNSD